YDETVATFRHGDGALCVSAIDAGILSDFFAAAQIVSIACSTCVACTSCAEPPLSAVARSYGPTKSPSMPGVDATVSTHARAAAVSTMAKARVPSLASRM